MSRYKLPLCSAALALFAVTPFALISTTAVAQSDSTITPITTPVGAKTPGSAVGTVVPRLVKFSGSIPESAGSSVTLHFSLYGAQTGGEPIWSESQSVVLSDQGKYSVLLGITTSPGLPQELFTTGAAKWLGVKQGEGEEAPRTLLLSAPYALKASDSDTLGGHPVTDFALLSAQPQTGTNITQINVGAGLTGGGTGPTVSLGLGPNVLTSLTGSNGLQVTQSGHAYYVTAGPGLITLGNTYFAQLAAANTFTKTNTFNGPVDVNNQLVEKTDVVDYFGVEGSNTGTASGGVIGIGPAVGVQAVGTATAAGDISYGVYAYSESETGVGVYGFAPTGGTAIGTYGQIGTLSSTGSYLAEFNFGTAAWGDYGGATGYGVVGTTDSSSFAGVFANNDDSGAFPSLLAINYSDSADSLVFEAYNPNSGTECTIDVDANVQCDGNFNAVHATSDQRRVETYSVQSSENWIEDFGSGQLSSGHATIALEPAFAKTVNTGVDYHVFLTPNGDSKGLYVTSKGPGSFEVHESNGGSSSISFDYRIVAKRLGAENVRLRDVTEVRSHSTEKVPARRGVNPSTIKRRPRPVPNVRVVSNHAALAPLTK